MGVKNLWDILAPVARPVQLDSLRQRKLAIDASIWLYHFLKAVRDKEGNALKNAHIVGFFRRICKLLYYNIKPVFVFDGGAPALKRLTIRERRQRRSERTKDLKKTAERLLETQLKVQAIREHEKRASAAVASGDVKDVIEGNYTYLDELQAAAAKSRKFRKDPYELPAEGDQIKKAKEMLDPRFATDEELRDFILEFKPSDLDVDSDTFRSLPTEIQYELIQDLKLKSRQTSWARLDEMIRKSKTSLDFSKQQIQHLMHRNVMTQRLLDVNSAVSNEKNLQPVRIASERGKQYVLVKNEDVSEGLGWKLPGLHNDKGTADKPLLEEDIQEENDIVDDENGEQANNDESKDKVLHAIESNPALQRLLKSMGDNDTQEIDSNDDFEEEDSGDDNELFVRTRPERERSIQDSSIQADILDNMNAYVEDNLSIQEIMARFQSKQELDEKLLVQHQITQKQPSPVPLTGPTIEEMSAQELVNYWIKSAPDAFIYEHSLNDEYKHIIRDIVYNLTVEEMESKLSAVSRKIGKLASHDDLRQESYGFHKTLLEDTVKWKRLQIELLEQFEKSNDASEITNPQSENEKMAWIGSDDEFDALDYSLLEEPTIPTIALPGGKITTQYQANGNKQKGHEQHEMKAALSASTRHSNIDSDIAISLRHSSLLRPINENSMEKQETVSLNQHVSNGADTAREVVQTFTGDEIEQEDSEDEQWQHVDMDHDANSQVSDKNIVPNLSPSSKDSPTKVEPFIEELQHRINQSPEKRDSLDIISDEDEARFQNVEKDDGSFENMGEHVVQSNVYAGRDGTHGDLSNQDDHDVDYASDQTNNQPDSQADDQTDNQTKEHFESLNQTVDADVDHESESLGEDQAQILVDQEGYNSEEELGSKLEAEDSEYARFVAEFGARDYSDVRQEINEELVALGQEQRRQKRDMDELTTQMIEDAQELLRLFGIPYIVSPMEAEAQCAELLQLSLVDGVVTDDSDVFLFGASKVYKNVFNQEKYVECYIFSDVERELSLDRQRLIQLAYLLGSDYTTGFAGVGQVAAMEILKEFQGDPNEPPLKPLQRFKEWWQTPVPPKDETSDFRKKFRKRHSGLEIPDDFPNPHVREAYISPVVDSSTQEFEWGMPDLDALRRFLYSMLGWDEKKVDGLVVPVIKEMNSRKAAAQASIGQFFDVTIDKPVQQPVRKRPYKSKRMQKVVQSLKEQDQEASKKRAIPVEGDNDPAKMRSTKRR